jgi:transposase-like protein
VRRAIQSSQESLIALAERYDINPKTVHKWRKRSFVIMKADGDEAGHLVKQNLLPRSAQG